MRLRLQVERQDLPAAKVLWNIEPASTTAELLELINDFFPLEAQGWGLEDYAVHVAGYEVLHFQQLGQVLKDDDEVTIKPLQTNDIRARTLSGRHQISADGRHLVDGIAYGRPLLRRPTRPPVHIPPRKRIRMASDCEATGDDAHIPDTALRQGHTLQGGQQLLAEPDPAVSDADQAALMRAILGAEADDTAGSTKTRQKKQKRVAFSGTSEHEEQALTAADDEDEDDEDEDDDDFEAQSDEDMETESDADDDSQTSDDYWDDFKADSTTGKEMILANGTSDEESDFKSFSDEFPSAESNNHTEDSDSETSSGSSSDSESESESEDDSESEAPSEEIIHRQVAQGDGNRRTKARNARRRDAKKLVYLKKQGTLPADATLADLKALLTEHPETQLAAKESHNVIDSAQINLPQHSSKTDTSQTSSLGAVQAGPSTESRAELEKKRANLLAAIEAGGIDVHDDLSGIEVTNGVSNDHAKNPTDDGTSAISTRDRVTGVKLDLQSSQRLLWASLGVRAPKTEADRKKLQAKLDSQTIRRPVARKPSATISAAPAPRDGSEDEASDPDAWRSKINLIAIECVEEGVEYSTPPFPFKQRWDPQMRNKKRKRSSTANNTHKELKMSDHENNSYLDYDDAVDQSQVGEQSWAGADNEVVPQTGSARISANGQSLSPNSQLLQEFQTTQSNPDLEPDLPSLPPDLTALPELKLADAKVGAIITFSMFEASAATNWQPGLAPVRTAKIDSVDEGDDGAKTLELKLARRDMAKKEYDHSGKRVYGKFEMAMGEDDEDGEEEGYMTVEVAELIEPRVLVAADEDGTNGDQSDRGAGQDVIQ
ncbi:hypothetical protein MBLNU459_g2270t1 [Dothideomycetes sp. NU459]